MKGDPRVCSPLVPRRGKVTTTNHTDKSQTLGDCLVTRAGATCTIMKHRSACCSIGVELAATRRIFSSPLSISSGSSESVSVLVHIAGPSDAPTFSSMATGRQIHLQRHGGTHRVQRRRVDKNEVQLGVVSIDAMSPARIESAKTGANQDDIGCSKGFHR